MSIKIYRDRSSCNIARSPEFTAPDCFIAYTREPDRHFVPLQTNLARHDALNEYARHTGSALFAVPAGSPRVATWARRLFEQRAVALQDHG